MTTYQKVSALLTKRHKKFFVALFFVSVCVSFFEMCALTLMMPFMALATQFEIVLDEKRKIAQLYSFLGFSSPVDFVFALGITVLVVFILNAAISVMYAYFIARFAQVCYRSISVRFFESFLHMPYSEFVLTNSDTIRKLIFTDAGHCASIINASLLFISEACTIVLIYALLLYMNPAMTSLLTVLFVFLVFSIKPISAFIHKQGVLIGNAHFEVNRIFTEAYHNFKFIRLVANEDYFSARYDKEIETLSGAQAINGAVQMLPRVMLETIGFMLLMVLVLTTIYWYRDASRVIPILSVYGFSFYRLLPSVNKLVINFNQIALSSGSMSDLDYAQHCYRAPSHEKNILFDSGIRLQNVSFSYKDNEKLLENVFLTIKKGEKVALIGASGSGKSTIVSLITGLVWPQKGQVCVDESRLDEYSSRSWRQQIGYIPQDIYLFDGSVASNVVFGRAYDAEKIVRALKRANIYDFLLSQEGLATIVGEGGVRLSGGQKQRIGIARALYLDPEILILDEATSALDEKTEKFIMKEIYAGSQGKTLIIISHRMSAVKKCDVVYEVAQGTLRCVDVWHMPGLLIENPLEASAVKEIVE